MSLTTIDVGPGTVLAASLAGYFAFHRYEAQGITTVATLSLGVPTVLAGLAYQQTNKLSTIFATFWSYWSLIVLFTVLYRISPFHPLAKYPGPFWSKITKFRNVGLALKGNIHKHYLDLHRQYGDIVRVGPNELSYCNADGVHPVIGNPGLPKGPFYDAGPAGSVLWERDRAHHANLRKPWNKAFNSTSLRDYDHIVITKIHELIDGLDKRTSEVVDISRWMDYFSFDAMGVFVFSFPFDMMKEGGDIHGYWRMITSSMARGAFFGQIPWARSKYLYSFLRLFAPSIVLLARKMVGHRMKVGSTTKDLFHHLSHEDDKPLDQLDIGYLIQEGMNTIVAGSDTTSTVLSNLWYYFLLNPSYYIRLREEVDANFASEEEPFDQEKLAAMPYLNACLQVHTTRQMDLAYILSDRNESMRLQPPVPNGSLRSVLPGTGGKTVGPHFIPEGTNITIPTYTLQRDPRYFSPYPADFWPDRWLEPENRKEKADITKPYGANPEFVLERKAFVPWSAGARTCVGKPLALLEMRIVASYIVKRFDMRPADGFDLAQWEERLQDQFVMKTGDLPVKLSRR